jgi:hypothetical protein
VHGGRYVANSDITLRSRNFYLQVLINMCDDNVGHPKLCRHQVMLDLHDERPIRLFFTTGISWAPIATRGIAPCHLWRLHGPQL